MEMYPRLYVLALSPADVTQGWKTMHRAVFQLVETVDASMR